MSTTDIILSTKNPSKATQIREIFIGLPVRILTIAEAGISGEAVEDGETLEENARKKALFAWQRMPRWCLADDTGLFIDHLGGRPGIHAARWAGDDATTEDIMRYTLEQLCDIKPENRVATFRTKVALITPNGTIMFFTGRVRGTILTEPRTECQPGMPYSAIFVPKGQDKTWAEMTTEEENAISHRGKAFTLVRNFLERTLV